MESDIRDCEKKREAIEQNVEGGVKAVDDLYLRLCAEFEYYKKRTAREMDKFKKFASESLIKEILIDCCFNNNGKGWWVKSPNTSPSRSLKTQCVVSYG